MARTDKEICQQTLKVLRNPNNFYTQILLDAFNGQVNIFDVADFRCIQPQDLNQSLNICVATMQPFKVTYKEGRNVYKSDEALGACFRKFGCVPATADDC